MNTMATMEEMYPDIVVLRELHGFSWTTIGKELHIDRRTAKKWYEQGSKEEGRPRRLDIKPEVDIERFTPFIASGDMMVTCDWHVPLYDPELINKLLAKAEEENIKKLIIGGDFFNADSVSRYEDRQKKKEAGYRVERKHALTIMDILLEVFKEIVFFEGNHDFRFVRFFDRQLDLEEVVKDVLLAGLNEEKLSRLSVSLLDHMYLEQEKLWRFSHQRDFSTVPLSVGRALATKYQCSVITAHSHHCAMGVAIDGQNLVIEGGGLYDKEVTEYIKKTSKHHEWVPGFTMFKEGIPTLFSPVFGNI